MSKYPKQAEVDKALKVVELQKEKERRMQEVKKEIGMLLGTFVSFSFSQKGKQIIFAGYDSKVRIGTSKCRDGDVFNKDIGKLIAIRRALGMPTDDLMDLVEEKSDIQKAIDNLQSFSKAIQSANYTFAVRK